MSRARDIGPFVKDKKPRRLGLTDRETGMDGQRLEWAGRPQGWDERRSCAGLLELCRTVGVPGAPKALGALAAGSAAEFAHDPEDRVCFEGGEAETP